MISIYCIKSYWYYIILLAILIRLIILYQPSDYTENQDAESAIRRAKTDACKGELRDFADNLSTGRIDIPPQLRRSCNLDTIRPRNQRIGYASSISKNIIGLEDPVVNASACLDLCFSYGHSHAGYDTTNSTCFCGDETSLLDRKEDGNCHQHNQFEWFKINIGIYHPTHNVPPISPVTNRTNIRIAFLLTFSGRSTLQIKRLIRNIYSEYHLYYIHIDKRDTFLFNQLMFLEKDFSNVVITRSRFNTVWGGPSLLRMMIDAMSHLMHHDWDYLINLSESDFPIKPLKALETYLLANNQYIYLKTHNIKGYSFIKKQGFDRNFYQCEDRVWQMGKRHLPKGIVYSGGSDWFALPRDFCSYIINNLSNSKTLVQPLMKIYNYTLLPAESFFHTLALNSEFCDKFVDNNLRNTNWLRKQSCKCQHRNVVDWCGCSPLIYRNSNWNKLARTNSSKNLFFSRKFDPTISSSIIDMVETELVHQSSVSNYHQIDTRFWQNIYSINFTIESQDQDLPTLREFGHFALKQIANSPGICFPLEQQLQTIDLYFQHDRFKGLIYKYCYQGTCLHLLVERNSSAHSLNNDRHLPFANERSLKVIEVNHGFDVGERMFRDYKPLGHFSDVVVYHEWLVNVVNNSIPGNLSATRGSLKFAWINPNDRLELVHTIRLKSVLKPTKLTLAHRLNVPKPLTAGEWTLSILQNRVRYLDYKFLIFDQTTFTDKKIRQDQFDKFYYVSKFCRTNESDTEHQNISCLNQDWILRRTGDNLLDF